MSLLINKILEICLKISGLWPYNFSYIGPAALLSTLLTMLPFQCWNALGLLHDPIMLMDSLSDILAEVLIIIKLFAMWASKRGIEDLVRDIDEDWNRKDIPNQWKIFARYCDIFCKFDIALYMSAVLFYYPDLISTYINKPPEKRQLLFQSYYPFDYHNSPNYELLNIMQIIQGFLLIGVDTLTKSLLVAYVLHVTARIHTLEQHIVEYSNHCSHIDDQDKNFQRLKIVITEHLRILVLVDRINTAYSYISLFQIVFSNIIICVTGFVIVTAMESARIILLIKFVLYILAMLSQAFTFCVAGQYLRDKGESIIYMIYDTLWYNAKPKEIKAIIFMISNAQMPLTLSGGKLIELSINSFTQIIKTSFSYLSVLRAVYA